MLSPKETTDVARSTETSLTKGEKTTMKKQFRFKTFFVICLICASTLFWSSYLYAAKFSIRIGFDGTSGGREHKNCQRFASMVENDVGKDVVEFKLYPDGTLGTLIQQVEGLQLGTHDMTLTSSVGHAVPEATIIDLPYLFKTNAVFERVMIGAAIQDDIFRKLEGKGLVPLCWLENGYRHITNNVRPIIKPSDLKGIKMRTPSAPVRIQMFQAWGANPAPLSFTELFSALRQGVFDGQENPLALIKDSRMFEVQKYLSLSKHVYNPLLLMISKKIWDRLPSNVQASLKNNALKASYLDRIEGDKIDNDSLDFLKGKIQINEVDFEAFREASKPVYAGFKYQDLLKRVLEISN